MHTVSEYAYEVARVIRDADTITSAAAAVAVGKRITLDPEDKVVTSEGTEKQDSYPRWVRAIINVCSSHGVLEQMGLAYYDPILDAMAITALAATLSDDEIKAVVDKFTSEEASKARRVRNLKDIRERRKADKEQARREFLELNDIGVKETAVSYIKDTAMITFKNGLEGFNAILKLLGNLPECKTNIERRKVVKEVVDKYVHDKPKEIKEEHITESDTVTISEGNRNPERNSSSTSGGFIRDKKLARDTVREACGRCASCDRIAGANLGDGGFAKLLAHHVIFLRHNGHDTYDNMVAICPNCHGVAHNKDTEEGFREDIYILCEHRLNKDAHNQH